MPKNTKSSASSGTRKKQAAKAAKKSGTEPSQQQQKPANGALQRGQKKTKGKKGEPKKKVYIPPVKPKQDVIDPLDSMGLASLLPSDLVVLLRKASKKDVITRTRALEGLLEWINAPTQAESIPASEEEEVSTDRNSALIIALPSWVHLLPRLSNSPNRRLRQLTVQISAKVFEMPDVLSELIAQPAMVENVIGPMLIIAHGPDRLVSRTALTMLEHITTWSDSETENIVLGQYMESIIDHLSLRLFDEQQGRDENESSQKSGTSTPLSTATRDAKNRDDVNVEEDSEATDARFVVGALGALGWLIQAKPSSEYLEQLLPILTSFTTWTALSPHKYDSRSLGALSPSVRVAAWNLVRILVISWPQGSEKCASILGPQALSSAFSEQDALVAQNMREALIRLLQALPGIWKMSKEDENDGEEDEDDSDEEDEDGSEDGDGDEKSQDGKAAGEGTPQFPMWQSFLDYLSNGVNGIASAYTLVILLLSTIPEEVFPPSSAKAMEVTQAMYAPIDEGQLEGRELQRAFVPAFLECLIWLCGRTATKNSMEEASTVAENITMIWQDFIDADSGGSTDTTTIEDIRSRRLNVFGEDRLVTELSTCLRKLSNINLRLASPILKLSRDALSRSLTYPAIPIDLVSKMLAKSIQQDSSPPAPLVQAVCELVRDITFSTANIIASGESIEQGINILNQMVTETSMAQDDDSMGALLLAFNALLAHTAEVANDELALFLTSYVFLLKDDEERRKSWCALLDTIVRPGDKIDWSLLRAVSRATIGKERALALQNSFSEKLDASFLAHYKDNIPVSARIIARPQGILSEDTPKKILAHIAKGTSQSELTLLEEWLKSDKNNVKVVFDTPEMRAIVVPVFELAIFDGDRQANGIWRLFSLHEDAFAIAKEVLQSQLVALERSIQDIVHAVSLLKPRLTFNDIVPSQESTQRYLSDSFSVSSPTELCVNDNLIPVEPEANGSSGESSIPKYDVDGLSATARISVILLASIEEDPVAGKKASVLPSLIHFAICAEDACLERNLDGGRALFSKTFDEITLKDYLEKAVSFSTSILSAKASGFATEWFALLAKVLQEQLTAQDEMQTILYNLWKQPLTGSLRVFERLLKGILNFSGAGQGEAELLLRAAQAIERKNPEKVGAIYLATNDLVQESPLYERLRNQAAADLAGVKSKDASSKGAVLLKNLMNLAPPFDSYTSLIPQQRAIFMLQTIQSWVASDEELPTEVFVRLAQAFTHILPIVQEIPGNHLDLIIDIVEMNLGDTDLTKRGGMSNLYFTLALLDTVIETASSSAAMREVWKDRKKDVLDAFRSTLLSFADTSVEEGGALASNAYSLVEEKLIDIVRSMPANLFKDDTTKLFRILRSTGTGSNRFLVTVYRLLAFNVREQVKELVVEAAVSGQQSKQEEGEGEEDENGDADQSTQKPIIEKDPKKLQIPAELTAILQDSQQENELAYLLAWLVTFDFFEESSLELRAAYTSHLQSLRLIDDHLLPFVLSKVSPTGDQGRWALDEVFLDFIESENATSIEYLAIHVFYRSLIHTPNLIRESYFSIKDKQQSNTVKGLTVRHLTPLLSQREFGHLRQADVLERLQDESMQIKVLGNSSEVIATYTVDEYPLEIAISMPNDYPLRAVEVRDIRKIGISEGTWRAWILGMRQLIAGRNGLIFDALLLFKRNVEAKFSGFDEDSTCAICYSIVSPTDHSLPTKPCKTCKKKFHSSCLFKWVSTSGSSTCPLCRSIL
ncbi:uncharacterized protein FA14DRAFT_193136 [Meira miltonrushii]|uniref:E3 ubiquitin-protein ligase listerin n=1 Tax=Meira miltonrushii TaxID=1280837 RepID=A0A316V6Z7_9BASI|nr:uncharacterized protein FA14DRAFT_193136 [Meira miltonrushii]PWN31235.1 hypothetical protein FA14DRAFT_193136 [Meira miltonrushii]